MNGCSTAARAAVGVGGYAKPMPPSWLERQKAESGLAARADLLTFFDYYEVDEGRQPR